LITANGRTAPVCLLTVISQDTQDLRIEGGEFGGGAMQMANGEDALEKKIVQKICNTLKADRILSFAMTRM